MADDYGKMLKEDLGALKQYLQQQQQIVDTSRPTGIFANVDPVMLGVAKGFLSPTRTGGFGESIGLGLAGAEAPLEAMRKRQMDAQEKIINARLAAAKLENDAIYYSGRRAGAGPSESSDLLNAGRYMDAAREAENSGNIELAAAYKAKAKELLGRHLTPTAKAAGDEAAAAKEAEPPPEEDKGSLTKLGEEIVSREPVTGASMAEGMAFRGGQNLKALESRKKWIEEQKKKVGVPEEAKGSAISEEPAPEEAAPETNFYTGDTPPKQFPQAQKAPDGKWYVVQDGKYRPVLK